MIQSVREDTGVLNQTENFSSSVSDDVDGDTEHILEHKFRYNDSDYEPWEFGTIRKEDSHFQIRYLQDGYFYYTIYNTKHKSVLSDIHWGYPQITYLEDDMLQILLSAGTYAFWCTYYDIANDRFSVSYECPVEAQYGKIAYISDYKNKKLTVCDIFESDRVYKEIMLEDASDSYVTFVVKGEFLDENTFSFTYLVGAQYEEKTVILELEK